MRVPRVYLDETFTAGRTLELGAQAARHVTRVLRLRPGASLRVFDGYGVEHDAVLTQVSRERALIETGAALAVDVESPLHITLAQGISRGERMDFVMQKATELGVTRIVPVLSDRSVVRLDSKRAAKRHAHWRSIVIGACEQSGRNRLPQLDTPVSFDHWCADLPQQGLRLMLAADGQQTPRTLTRPGDDQVSLFIGPEGGLSTRERDVLQANRFESVSLGPRILRTETAALAILAILQSLWV